MFTNTSRHVRFAAASIQLFSPVRPRPRLTHHHQELFPLTSADLQDEAERIHESNAEEDVIDLPEQERKCTQGLVCHNHFPILINVFLV